MIRYPVYTDGKIILSLSIFLFALLFFTPTLALENNVLLPNKGTQNSQNPLSNKKIQGNALDSKAKVIARWNVIPFQTFSEKSTIGVVAFHINGIDRVEFRMDGGPVLVVDQKSLNTRTNTYEYLVELDPALYRRMKKPDGIVAISATIFPMVFGLPRKLPPLLLNMNGGKTLKNAIVWASENGNDTTGNGSKESPFRQPYRALQKIQKRSGNVDGAVVYLLPGKYEWGPASSPTPTTKNRWLSIVAAPGIEKSKVIINKVGSGGFKTKLLHVKNIVFDNVTVITAGGSERYLWIDSSQFFGPGRTQKKRAYQPANWKSVFITDSLISKFSDGAIGAEIVRNVDVENIGSDAFSNSKLVINSRVRGIDPSGTTFHPDVYQLMCGDKSVENIILYGVIASESEAQGLFSDNCSYVANIAFINVLITRPLKSNPKSPHFSQWTSPTNHLLLQGVSLPNSKFVWRSTQMKNIGVTASVFYIMSKSQFRKRGTPLLENSWFKNNHFINPWAKSSIVAGTEKSVGNPFFVNPKLGDFRPLPNSPLKNRLPVLFDLVDAQMKKRDRPGTIGALN